MFITKKILGFSMVGLLLLGSLHFIGGSFNARAQDFEDSNGSKPTCQTLEECWALAEIVDARIKKLLVSAAPRLDDIARNVDGSVKMMNQNEAIKYCAEKNLTLPTARELVLVSESLSLGASGIRRTRYPDTIYSRDDVQAEIKAMRKDNFLPIYSGDAALPVVGFYFNHRGYEGSLGDYWFWSSSVHPVYPEYGYYLSGKSGSLPYGRSFLVSNHAVRCKLPH